MFSIKDGRYYLYQWDLNRQLIINDPSITEVHFCNGVGNEALVVEVKDGLANVPNIITQNSFTCRVYAYNDEHTLFEQKLEIKPRCKPSDYVYTETEIVAWQTIVNKVDSKL